VFVFAISLYAIEDELSTIDDTDRVARAIRRRREQLGLTIRGLAAKSGVSPSMISDIERIAKSPTVSTLSALAAALGVPTAALISDSTSESNRIHVVRAAERLPVADRTSGVTRESLGPAIAGSKVEFLRCVVPPRSLAGPFDPHPRGTIEHVHLASGSIRMVVGSDSASLAAGDTCSCFADLPHSFDNRDGKKSALLYIVIESA
jgi:transcriptional regulator with XRE-family HTH domain